MLLDGSLSKGDAPKSRDPTRLGSLGRAAEKTRRYEATRNWLGWLVDVIVGISSYGIGWYGLRKA